jgi:hypothetical protein
MSLFNFASSLKRIFSARPTRGLRQRSRYRTLPRLEHLEDRFVPAVTNLTSHVSFATIQAAVNSATAGDTIVADADVYAETVTINKSLTLEGAQHGVDARDGRPGAKESILSLGFGGLQLNADGITIDGFTVRNASGSNTNGLIAGGATSNNFVLKNTILTDDNAVTGAPILFQGGSHTNMQFTQDLFQDKGDSTFYFGSSAAGDLYDGLTISNSKFLGLAGGVFYAAGSSGNPLKNAVIQGNEFDGTVNGVPGVGDPILNIGQSVNLTIKGNYFHDEDYTAFQVGMIGGSITGNTFARIHADPGAGFGDAFQLWGGQYGTAVSTDVTIANNLINYNDVVGAVNPTRGLRLRPQDAGSSAPGIDGTTIHVHDNAFVNGGVLSSGAFALVNQGDPTKPVDASANWWGTTNDGAIATLMSGHVDFTPYFHSGTNTAVGYGFQGDYSVLDVTAKGSQTTSTGRIQEAVNLVSPGGTVNVNAGTYNELVTIDKTLTLLGAQHGVDARDGRPGAKESVVSNSEGDFQVEADHVTIDGFTLTGVTANPNTDSASLGAAIWTNPGFSGTHGGVKVVNNIIQGNIAGIELDNDGTFQARVQFNLFRDNDQPGAGGGTDIETSFGLSNALIESNTFANTSFVDNAWALGVSAASDHVTFSHNSVTNHGRGVYFFSTSDAVVTFNTITGASHYAIGLFGNNGSPANSSFTISNNTLDAGGSGGAGVELVNDTSASAYSGTLELSDFGLLVADVTQQVVKVRPGIIHYGDTEVDYNDVSQVNLDNTAAVNAIAGPDTADRATAFAGLTADERFVQALYLDDLGRAGSKAELDSWLPVLGAWGQQAAAADIQGSFEGRDHLVKAWYQTYLGRAADGTEELGWVGALQAGRSEEQVLSHVLGSTEFYDRAQTLIGGSDANANYVQALYLVLLDRKASDSEVAGWVNVLSQADRPAVALGFLASREFRTDQFEGYYNALLLRPSNPNGADPTGLNGWVFSNLDVGAVRIGFGSSPEFFTNG